MLKEVRISDKSRIITEPIKKGEVGYALLWRI
jgi:hypothetical protein